jgi:hypothetical protein
MSADSLRDRLSRKEYAQNQGSVTETAAPPKSGGIALSRSGAEFFLDKDRGNSYHDAKFLRDASRHAIFHLRPLEKSLNWRSCFRAGVALLFGLRVRDAFYIEGRKPKG